MGIFDKIFGRELEPGEQYKKDVEAAHKQIQKLMANEKAKRDHITNCVILMKDCRKKFVSTIMNERDIATKKKRSGIPTDREKTRIHEAAIGILTVDTALFDLQSISSEADLNKAMNNMGKALRQLIRLDNSTTAITSSAKNFIDMFYPSFKSLVNESENYTAVKKTTESAKKGQPTDIVSIYEIPQEIRARINDTFVENLLAGDSYEMAMFKAVNAPVKDQVADPAFGGGLSKEDWERLQRLSDEPDDGSLVSSSSGFNL